MCGRIACTLCKPDLLEAARTYSYNHETPKWIEKYSWQTYKPSYNVSPKMVTPVLLSEKTLLATYGEDGDSQQLCLFPMKWGLIPPWYKGAEKDFNLSTHNCRCEKVLEKPVFRSALRSEQRCVILVDGFFEWKSVGSRKKPYFIYLDSESGIDMKSRSWKDECFFTSSGVWNGPCLLPLAGVFDVWNSPEIGLLYTYTIFTMNASKTIAPVHARMPVVLDDVEKVHKWLNLQNDSFEEALHSFSAVEKLKMYEVAPVVNNSKSDEIACVMPYEEKDGSQKITSWFTTDKQTSDAPKM